MILRHSACAVVLAAIVLGCPGCGVKGPLYLPPAAQPAASDGTPAPTGAGEGSATRSTAPSTGPVDARKTVSPP